MGRERGLGGLRGGRLGDSCAQGVKVSRIYLYVYLLLILGGVLRLLILLANTLTAGHR